MERFEKIGSQGRMVRRVLLYVCISGLDQYWMGQDWTIIPEELVYKIIAKAVPINKRYVLKTFWEE